MAISKSSRSNQEMHGLTKSREYRTWAKMKERCGNPNSDKFEYYGGRGIYVAARWLQFGNFYADMGQKPTPKHTIERIDNDGPYAWWNCKWATKSIQCRNRRTTRMVTHNGKAMCLSEWSQDMGISTAVLSRRAIAGMTPATGLFDIPKKPQRRMILETNVVEFDGVSKTLKEWSHNLGIKMATFRERILRGLTPDTGLFVIPKPQNFKTQILEFRGRSQSMRAWAEEFGLRFETLRHRQNVLKLTPETGLFKPSAKGGALSASTR